MFIIFFKKNKKEVSVDVSVSYLEWFNREGMPKGKLGMQLATVYEIKLNGLMELLIPIRALVKK